MGIFEKLNKRKTDRALRVEHKKYKPYRTERLSRHIHVYASTDLSQQAVKTIRLVCRTWQEIHHYLLLDPYTIMTLDTSFSEAEEYFYAFAEISLIAQGGQGF